jgi:hypothetical protein
MALPSKRGTAVDDDVEDDMVMQEQCLEMQSD